MVTIDRLHVQGFASLRSMELELGPIVGLIGENDTGKSNVLKSLLLLAHLARVELERALQPVGGLDVCAFMGDYSEGIRLRIEGQVGVRAGQETYSYDVHLRQAFRGGPPEISHEELRMSESLHLTRKAEQLTLTRREGKNATETVPDSMKRLTFLAWAGKFRDKPRHPQLPWSLLQDPVLDLAEGLARLEVYRLLPEAMRPPAPPSDAPRLGADGSGLASMIEVYATDPEYRTAFEEMRSNLRRAIPYMVGVGLRPLNDQGVIKKKIHFQAVFGGRPLTFDADRASDGLLLLLAFLVLSHSPYKAPIVLLEEPENGLHVNRLSEIVGMLRQFFPGTDGRSLLMTTHSPFLLDALSADEVHIMTRDAQSGASRMHRMSQFPDLDRWRKGFSLGEIWRNLGEERLVGG